MLHFHRERYEVLGWCVMPNHVHVLVHVWRMPLSKLVQSWKSYVAVRANEILRQRKRFWEPEYWDTFMLNEKQEQTAINYIENNPSKARLLTRPWEWPYSSARFRSPKTRELVLPSGAQSSSSA